jgi:hypothetical protein
MGCAAAAGWFRAAPTMPPGLIAEGAALACLPASLAPRRAGAPAPRRPGRRVEVMRPVPASSGSHAAGRVAPGIRHAAAGIAPLATRYEPLPALWACGMQHAACSMQHAACSLQREHRFGIMQHDSCTSRLQPGTTVGVSNGLHARIATTASSLIAIRSPQPSQPSQRMGQGYRRGIHPPILHMCYFSMR